MRQWLYIHLLRINETKYLGLSKSLNSNQLPCHPDDIPFGTHAITVSQSLKPIFKLNFWTPLFMNYAIL